MPINSLIKLLVFLFLTCVCIFGLQPFQASVDANKTLVEQEGIYANEVKRLSDGTYLVAVRTDMPDVKADMVRWWFKEFLQTSEQYKLWHPKDHIWMNWENKKPKTIIGASHLVHEYIGNDLNKLRINFIDPSEFFGYDPNDINTFVLCAKVGYLLETLNIAKMCHIIRDTKKGSEMRTRFWLGHVEERDRKNNLISIQELIGNTSLARLFMVTKEDAEDLKKHAEEEMKFLSEILPNIYNSNITVKK